VTRFGLQERNPWVVGRPPGEEENQLGGHYGAQEEMKKAVRTGPEIKVPI
jgi:hypothetical protein